MRGAGSRHQYQPARSRGDIIDATCHLAISQLTLASLARLVHKELLIVAMNTIVLCRRAGSKKRSQQAHSRGDVACLLAIGQLTLASRARLDQKFLLIVAVLTDHLNYLHIRRGSMFSCQCSVSHVLCVRHTLPWTQTAVHFPEYEEEPCHCQRSEDFPRLHAVCRHLKPWCMQFNCAPTARLLIWSHSSCDDTVMAKAAGASKTVLQLAPPSRRAGPRWW